MVWWAMSQGPPIQMREGFAVALGRILGWRRILGACGTALPVFLVLAPGWKVSLWVLVGRLLFVGLLALMAFGLLERWPSRLPAWLPRWVLRVVAVALAVPAATLLGYWATTQGDPIPWWRQQNRIIGFGIMTFMGMLLAPWAAMAALLRQVTGEAQRQALSFELERSEWGRRELDARLRTLQAQVEPHFLFNTLANVRELVETGSPRASAVLGSLIAYLRAAVPRLHETSATLGQELELARAYLEVMHLRMPDRLSFSVEADPAVLGVPCPPMTLLTLVENAVRHGLDPSEEGGRIEVKAELREGRCVVAVVDTGVGLGEMGTGTGLSNLQERLRLAYGPQGLLVLQAHEPTGVRAEVGFPAGTSR